MSPSDASSTVATPVSTGLARMGIASDSSAAMMRENCGVSLKRNVAAA
jgi:hypothetical protein